VPKAISYAHSCKLVVSRKCQESELMLALRRYFLDGLLSSIDSFTFGSLQVSKLEHESANKRVKRVDHHDGEKVTMRRNIWVSTDMNL
jgi:hypothetical protein